MRAVQAFEAVGRCGSVTAAALELDVSPGAITQQIRLLEEHLGARLTQRSGRGVALTRWGERYLPYAAAAMSSLIKGAQELASEQRSNHLALSALPSMANRWLGPLLFNWKKDFPDSSIHLEGEDAEPRLTDVGVDFRVSYGARSRCHQYCRYLFTDYLVPVASPVLLAGRRLPLEPMDILRLPLLWVDWKEQVGPPHWRDWLATFGIMQEPVPCAVTYSFGSAAVEAAVQGHGCVLAQYSMIEGALANGTLVQLFDRCLPLPEAYYLAWNAASLDKRHGKSFHAWLMQVAQRFDWSAAAARGVA